MVDVVLHHCATTMQMLLCCQCVAGSGKWLVEQPHVGAGTVDVGLVVHPSFVSSLILLLVMVMVMVMVSML